MQTITASSPTKAIIAGEHSVVYGGIAISAPLSIRKSCICTWGKKEGIGSIRVDDSMGVGVYFGDHTFEDLDGWFAAKAKLIEYLLKSEGKKIEGLEIKLVLSKNKILKGTGHSAAASAAISICLYSLLGISPSKEKLFSAVQKFEEVAHGGRASGIDAQTVISNSSQEFRKIFANDGNAKFEFEDIDLQFPKGTALLVINSKKIGGKTATTAEMVQKFADHHKISKKPFEMTEKEREKITAPFDEIVEGIKMELHQMGDAKKLGALLTKNHELLKKAGVSAQGIEEARQICEKNSCHGFKITGAGGEGGAAIALANERDVERIIRDLKSSGFDGMKAQVSVRGASLME
ncbi:hypothetical protein HY989_02950 [Candidatus Micrarchaeota archaeon]|nr:hypothetical protein [Candidatus Micrarchaeota archaeon]